MMLWSDPNRNQKNPKDVVVYVIRSGSDLDVPRHLLLKGQKFESALEQYFYQKVIDVNLILSMVPIYRVYMKEGAVVVHSTQNKFLRYRHERVIINMIKNNMRQLEQLDIYNLKNVDRCTM
ncbi:MAG TPA: hypothetical protein VN843_36105 [Anaerolineales bacterium]|nr:hypothetical protein [Anaerolineales bacterium]